jgi:hypothetical protein
MSLQYPFFTATLGLFGGICLAGVGLAGWQYLSYSGYEKKLKDVLSDREQILNSPIAPTEENLERAKKNYDNIVAREQELYEILKGNKTTVDSSTAGPAKKAKVFPEEDNQQPADLVNKLRESANRLSAQFKSPKVRIYRVGGSGRTSDFGFGFKRYVSATDGTTPRNRLRDIALEKTLIEYFVNHLVKAQSEDGSPLILQAVMREPVEIPRERSITSSINSDEYIPTQVEVVRSKGIVDSYYFRFTFTTRTGLVRRWINKMDSEGYPLFLRGITVAPAKPEVLAPEETAIPGIVLDSSAPLSPPPAATPLPGFAGFGEVAPPPPPVPSAATPAAPEAPGKTGNKDAQIILEATPSEFTVSFEYVLPATETAGKPSNN